MKLKQTLKICTLLATLGVATSCKEKPNDIPFVGLDGNGELKEINFPGKEFKKYNARAMKYTKKETLKALSKIEKAESNSWVLDAVEVGLAAKAGLGLGNVLKAEAEPAFILIYKKRK